jgi:hypothetical protein
LEQSISAWVSVAAGCLNPGTEVVPTAFGVPESRAYARRRHRRCDGRALAGLAVGATEEPAGRAKPSARRRLPGSRQ